MVTRLSNAALSASDRATNPLRTLRHQTFTTLTSRCMAPVSLRVVATCSRKQVVQGSIVIYNANSLYKSLHRPQRGPLKSQHGSSKDRNARSSEPLLTAFKRYLGLRVLLALGSITSPVIPRRSDLCDLCAWRSRKTEACSA